MNHAVSRPTETSGDPHSFGRLPATDLSPSAPGRLHVSDSPAPVGPAPGATMGSERTPGPVDPRRPVVSPYSRTLDTHFAARIRARRRPSISPASASISRSKSAIRRSRTSRRARLGPQLKFGQERAATGPEQLAVAVLDALARDQRMTRFFKAVRICVSTTRWRSRSRRSAARAGRCRPPGAGRRAKAAPACAHRPRRSSPAPTRSPSSAADAPVQLTALALEQLGQPLPAVGRLQRKPRVLDELPEQLTEAIGSLTNRRESSCSPCSSTTATCERLRCRSIPTYTMRGPPSVPEHNARPGHNAPGTGSLGGPLIHGIKSACWIAACRGRVPVGAGDDESKRRLGACGLPRDLLA